MNVRLANDINNGPGTSCCVTVEAASMSVILQSVPKSQQGISRLERGGRLLTPSAF